MKALNPTLYRSLVRLFDGHVEIVNEGQPMHGSYRRDWSNPDPKVRGRLRLQIADWGESYKISCPFCNDTRHRLLISHRWGVQDPQTGLLNLKLLKCFNEDCQDDITKCGRLYEEAYSNLGARRGRSVGTQPARAAPIKEAPPRRLQTVEWPGPVIRLDQLGKRYPNHPALKYLAERGFNPGELGQRYQISYCRESKYSLARNRIVVPFFMDGMMVGWQCRLIGNWRKGDPPKYWTMPGMLRRQIAYGFDEAVKHRTVGIVEGPFDKLRFGPQAMALLGKTMSAELLESLKKRLPKQSTVVVVLDPDQAAAEREKGRPHHIDVLVRQLRPLFPGRVARVMLPAHTDPGSLDRDCLFDIIERQAKAQNVRVHLDR